MHFINILMRPRVLSRQKKTSTQLARCANSIGCQIQIRLQIGTKIFFLAFSFIQLTRINNQNISSFEINLIIYKCSFFFSIQYGINWEVSIWINRIEIAILNIWPRLFLLILFIFLLWWREKEWCSILDYIFNFLIS